MKISKATLLGHLQKTGVVKSSALVKSQQEHQRDPEKDDLPAVLTSAPGVEPVQAVVLNPHNRMFRGGKNVIEPNKRVTFRVLRTVAEKGFLINTIINHLSNRVRPYLKPSTNKNIRGFQIRMKDPDVHPSQQDKTNMAALTKFFLRTGFDEDPEREDNLIKWGMKFVRDALTIDQISTEIQLKFSGRPHAFFAVDPATITKVSERGYEGDDKIKYIQEIDTIPVAWYTHQQMVFDYRNPRSDIEYYGYGYSETEQAIDLITSMINTFVMNAGFFTENRLPRGMLLLNGDADMETVETIEDYIVNIMSGGPGAQWRVPIIPAGFQKGESGKAVEWISLQQNNRDMEFSQWQEFLWSSVAALFGTSLEEMGIKTSKSTALLGDNMEPRIEESKSKGLSNVLSFMQDHLNNILERIDSRYVWEFVGYEKDDVKLKNATIESQIGTFKTVDEVRAEHDLPPFNEEWSKVPLNAVVAQMISSAKTAEQMAAGGGQGGPGAPPQIGAAGGPPKPGAQAPGGKPGQAGDEPQRSIHDPDALEDDEPEEDNPDAEKPEQPEEPAEAPKRSIYSMKKAIIIEV